MKQLKFLKKSLKRYEKKKIINIFTETALYKATKHRLKLLFIY